MTRAYRGKALLGQRILTNVDRAVSKTAGGHALPAVTGPDADGFFYSRIVWTIDKVTLLGSGTSRSPTGALAYALEDLAAQLLGKPRAAPGVPRP